MEFLVISSAKNATKVNFKSLSVGEDKINEVGVVRDLDILMDSKLRSGQCSLDELGGTMMRTNRNDDKENQGLPERRSSGDAADRRQPDANSQK